MVKHTQKPFVTEKSYDASENTTGQPTVWIYKLLAYIMSYHCKSGIGKKSHIIQIINEPLVLKAPLHKDSGERDGD